MSASGPQVEVIERDGRPLTYIIHTSPVPSQTTFLTPPELLQQVGFVVYPAGGEVARHIHRLIERRVVGTAEVVLVQQGRCVLDVYSEDRELVASRELEPGDLMLLVGGGHGFRMLEDTVLLEIKQGPYTGLEEKERF